MTAIFAVAVVIAAILQLGIFASSITALTCSFIAAALAILSLAWAQKSYRLSQEVINQVRGRLVQLSYVDPHEDDEVSTRTLQEVRSIKIFAETTGDHYLIRDAEIVESEFDDWAEENGLRHQVDLRHPRQR